LAPQLQLRHHLAAHDTEGLLLRRRDLARRATHDGEHAEEGAVRGDQRCARIESDLRLANDERIIREPRVLSRVRNDDQLSRCRRMREEFAVPGDFTNRAIGSRLSPETPTVDERDQRDQRARAAAHMHRQRGEVV
jgi:hypothetical protein